MSEFPVDDVTLVMLTEACRVNQETGRSHLHEFLEMGARETSRELINPNQVEDGAIEIYMVEHEDGYGIFTEHDAILALVEEVQRLRAAKPGQGVSDR